MEDCPILQVLREHTSDVTSCDTSNGNLLATGSSDKTVRVWEWKPGLGFSQVAYSPLPPHKYAVTWVRFSPQGTMLVSASVDGTTALWNTRTGTKIHTVVQVTRCSVRRCEFTPDSSKLITAGDDGVFCFWDLLRGTLIKSYALHEEDDSCILGLAISCDSELMVTGDTSGLLKLWSLSDLPADDLECLNFTKYVNDGIACCAFSPKRVMEASDELKVRYTVATSGCDGVIRLWAITTVRGSKVDVQPDIVVCDMVEEATMEGHESDVHDVRFNACGSLLCSTGLDKVVRVWKVDTKACLYTLDGHNRFGNCCVFTKDSSIVVSGSNDKTLVVWDLKGSLSLHSEFSPPCCLSSHFSTDSTALAEELVAQHVENNGNKLELVQLVTCSAAVNSVAFAGNNLLAIGGGDKAIRLYERRGQDDTFTEGAVLEQHKYSINGIDISPCGSKIISCSMNGTLIHWDVQTGLTCELKAPSCFNCLRACRFSPSNDIIAAAGDDEFVFLWDAASMEFIQALQQHRDAVTDIAFSPDGNVLASTSCAGDIELYDLQAGSPSLLKDNAHDLGAASCSFAFNYFLSAGDGGDYVLASSGNDSLVIVWIATSSSLLEWGQLCGHGGNVMQVRFSVHSPSILVSSATDSTARVWNAKSLQCLYVVEHHESMVNTCAFSLDSTLLATGSIDKSVAIWRVPDELIVSAAGFPSFRLVKKLQNWSCEDVKQFLTDMGHGATGHIFWSSGITGRTVLGHNEDDILENLQIDDEEERLSVAQLLWWIKKEAVDEVGLCSDDDIPHQFLCPITHEIMLDPVLCSDGFTYERAAITEWMLGGRFSSPMTNEHLTEASFAPNVPLKIAILSFKYGERP